MCHSKVCRFGFLSILVLSLLGCIEEAGYAYIEHRYVDQVESWLQERCKPNYWCEPYAESAAKMCLAKHLDLEQLNELPENQHEVALKQIMQEVRFCTLENVYAQHAETQQQGT